VVSHPSVLQVLKLAGLDRLLLPEVVPAFVELESGGP
jgi:hypothetical protein